MGMRKALLALVLAAGCSSEPSIDGDWVLPLSDACVAGFTFDSGAGTYSTGIVCGLATGGAGADIEFGDADFSTKGIVKMIPRRASCPSAMHSQDTGTYSFDSGKLVLGSQVGGAVGIFERPPGGPAPSAVIRFGCWDMGVFTPHTVEAL